MKNFYLAVIFFVFASNAEAAALCTMNGKTVHETAEKSGTVICKTKEGTIVHLECGKEPYVAEDKKLCGWDKPSEVFVNDRFYSYSKGKLVKFQDFYSKGKLKTENLFEGKNETRITFHENGKLKSVKVLEDKVVKSEKAFYEDGTPKFEYEFEYKDGKVFINKKSFFTNGNPQVVGRYFSDPKHNYDLPVGLIKTYYEMTGLAYEENFNSEGKLEGESLYYGENGKVILRKVFKDGALVSEKNF